MDEMFFDLPDGARIPLQGGAILAASVKPVSATEDELEFALRGTADEVRQTRQRLGRAFSQAQSALMQGDMPATGATYWLCRVHPADLLWRSRILALRWDAPAWEVNGMIAVGRLHVWITRLPFWEGEEVALALSNAIGVGNGDPTPDGLTVFNANDGLMTLEGIRHNWVELAEDAVPGELPVLARVELLNLGARAVTTVWMGVRSRLPVDFAPLLEAEAGARVGSDTIFPADDCSSGVMAQVSLPSGVETELLRWQLPRALFAAGSGEWLRPILRFAREWNIAQVALQLALEWDVTRVWQSGWAWPELGSAFAIRAFDPFRLPDTPDPAALDLVLRGTQHSGASLTIALDFLALLPFNSGQTLRTQGYGAAVGAWLMEDGAAQSAYLQEGADAGRVSLVSRETQGIWLTPGLRQRISFFSHSNLAYVAEIHQRLQVRMWVRPRKEALT